MNNREIYDAITRIDERLIERVTPLFENQRRASTSQSAFLHTERRGSRPIRIAALVIALATVVSVAVMTVSLNDSNQNSSATEQEQDPDKLPFNTVQAFNFKNSSDTGKPSASSIYSIISTPSVIRNNSEFTLKCSFGIPYAYPLLKYDNWKDNFDFTFNIRCRNSGYYYGVTENGDINFFGERSYSESIDPDRLTAECLFDPGITVVRDGNTTYYVCSNIQNVDSLPFQLSVPCKVGELTPGTFGVILVGTVFSAKYGNTTRSDGSKMYYYCSGDYIGFGATEEEAYNNSLINEPGNDNVEAVDAHKQQLDRGIIDGYCY